MTTDPIEKSINPRTDELFFVFWKFKCKYAPFAVWDAEIKENQRAGMRVVQLQRGLRLQVKWSDFKTTYRAHIYLTLG